ncbi:trypsin-like peptidase domain-containing protein [Candidatus Daviesbacteria bacterium]|nr:trypsin-like peptidase domain-containing protein [Candidatus Daviesbacteria bacterium]
MSDKIKLFLIAAVVGVLAGVTTFRLVVLGKLPFKITSDTGQLQVQNTQTRTIVQEENAIISTVEKTSPSVVAIGINQRIVNPFDPFSVPKNQQSTIGTGFVVSDKGIIVTNRHVVADTGAKYSVVTKDGKKLEITRIYRDPNLDLALVQVASVDGLKALELGDSAKLKVGQTVIAIGNALGRFDNTVTTGVVSGLGRSVSAGDPFGGDTERLDDLIQTDAAINPGNSGGPLLNSAGQVIGVNVATTEGAQNIGFTIPINSVKSLVDEFHQNGTISRAFLGIRYRLMTRDIALLNEVPQGAYIQEVVTGSPAEKVGVNAGDIVTKIDGQTINEENKISKIIQSKKIGQTVSLEVWTDGKTRTVTATLAESPNQ